MLPEYADSHISPTRPKPMQYIGVAMKDPLPEWSKGVDSSSTSASCVGSNPTGVSFGQAILHQTQLFDGAHALQQNERCRQILILAINCMRAYQFIACAPIFIMGFDRRMIQSIGCPLGHSWVSSGGALCKVGGWMGGLQCASYCGLNPRLPACCACAHDAAEHAVCRRI